MAVDPLSATGESDMLAMVDEPPDQTGHHTDPRTFLQWIREPGGAPKAPSPPRVPVQEPIPNPIANVPAKVAPPKAPMAPQQKLSSVNDNLRFQDFDRLRVLDKLIANKDFTPTVAEGRMKFKSLTDEENQVINGIGWGRAGNVSYEEESSPFTAPQAWEKNIKHWRELSTPPTAADEVAFTPSDVGVARP